MTPKISVVFTSFNHREFLKEALDALINQTFKDFELIIIDDNSSDGSQEILQKYTYDKRVKLYLLEKNTGSYVYSSNIGASKAKSEYIIFAQCDDVAEKTQLEKLYNTMMHNPEVGVAFSSSMMIDKNGASLGCDFDGREKRFKQQCVHDTFIPRLQMTKYFLNSCVIPNLSAALMKRSLYEKLNGLSTKFLVVSDWDFWMKMTLECDFYYLRNSLNRFRQHDTTIRSTIKINIQIIEIYLMMYRFFLEIKLGFSEKIKFKVRLAIMWIHYFPHSPKVWIKSFPSISLQLFSIDRLWVIYFLIAATKTFLRFIKKIKIIN
jgi:glycosyltransferase involved in cell wall biosynthesis